MHASSITEPDRQGPGGMPVEIWGNVTKLLSLQDCCKLASTCQALWSLDLPRMVLPSALGKKILARGDGKVLDLQHLTEAVDGCQTSAACLICAALEWAAKRWANAQLLKVTIRSDNVRQLSHALAYTRLNDLAQLHELHVDIEEGTKLLVACELACSWLLTQASNIQVMHPHPTRAAPVFITQQRRHSLQPCAPVQVLNANVVHLNKFGRARGIKHLLLESPGLHCGRLSTALAALEQLQTLWLNDRKGPKPQTPGALQLNALTALRTVALDGLVPESIQLNEEGCELHVAQHSYPCIKDAVWDTVLPHLRSVWVSDSSAFVRALPSCLLKAEKLTRASLRVHRFGTTAAPVPLKGAVAQAGALAVQCKKDLHATVPADVAWQEVSLAATNVLDLQFEAVATFGETIPAFCFRHYYFKVGFPLSSAGQCSGWSNCLLLPTRACCWTYRGHH